MSSASMAAKSCRCRAIVMSDADEYGPHTAQLKHLAERLSAFTGDDWTEVGESLPISEACFGLFEWLPLSIWALEGPGYEWLRPAYEFAEKSIPQSEQYE